MRFDAAKEDLTNDLDIASQFARLDAAAQKTSARRFKRKS